MGIHEGVRRMVSAMVSLLRPLVGLVSTLFGKVDWEPPVWLDWLATRLIPVRKWCHDQAAWALFVLVLLIAGAWAILET